MNNAPSTNIFDYATSELSQDAFFAWLSAWADIRHKVEAPDLHNIARAFITWIHERSGNRPVPDYDHVEPIRQHLKIDLLIRLYGPRIEHHEEQYLLIEDKTYTNDYSTQIQDYFNALAKEHKRGKRVISISEQQILPVYVKTWIEPPKQTKIGDRLIARLCLPEIVAFFEGSAWGSVPNDILRSWCMARRTALDNLMAFRSTPILEWNYDQWYGCFHSLTTHGSLTELKPDYEFVNNAAGGFMACTLAWQVNPGEMYLYVQIDAYESQLPTATFRVGGKSGELVSLETCRKLFDVLKEIGGERGFNVTKPMRLKSGASSRFARAAGPFLCVDEEGIFDEDRALEHIRVCDSMLKECAVRMGFKSAQSQLSAT